MSKILLSEFIERSNYIHNSEYDYSLVSFKNNDSIVSIICPIHGVFNQNPGGDHGIKTHRSSHHTALTQNRIDDGNASATSGGKLSKVESENPFLFRG